MTTESNEHPSEQAPEQAPTPTPQGELWMNDVKETGRWGSRSRREVLGVITIIFLMILVTFCGVFFAAKNANKSDSPAVDEPVGNTKLDPVTGKLVSAYELPKKPANIIISDQEELDMIINAISSSNVTSEKASMIPKTVAELGTANLENADPYLKAAVWITNVDSTNVQQDVIQRFVLAVIFHTTNGASWKNSTNWLSSSYHCDWYGVTCCEHVFGAAVCKIDSFGEILELDFYKNNLVGSISSVVVHLPHLHVLYLNRNKLTGTIPGNAFAAMPNFAKLYAQYNALSGSIPAELGSSALSKYTCWNILLKQSQLYNLTVYSLHWLFCTNESCIQIPCSFKGTI